VVRPPAIAAAECIPASLAQPCVLGSGMLPTCGSTRSIVEADDEDAAAVAEAIAKAICSHPPDADHACPRRWITMQHELADEEAQVWREPDALNR
jgi:hypothetical protein